MKAFIFYKQENINWQPSFDEMREAIHDANALIWVDLDRDPLSECQMILGEIFQFHPLSIDDALVETHVPKIDDWDGYLYLTLIALKRGSEDFNSKDPIELDIFVGSNYVVTYHQEEIQAVNQVWNGIMRDHRRIARGKDYLVYQLFDELADDLMAIIDQMDLKVDNLEDLATTKPDNTVLEEIFTVKRSLLNLRRIIAPQREILNKLSRGDYLLVNRDDRMYYRDVYDHFVRVYEITESLRDIVSGLLETYLSVVNNRLNDIMKTLTIITTLFMPLTFLTGFFGMNFFSAGQYLKGWTGKSAFLFFLILMVAIPIGMFIWMRRKKWME